MKQERRDSVLHKLAAQPDTPEMQAARRAYWAGKPGSSGQVESQGVGLGAAVNNVTGAAASSLNNVTGGRLGRAAGQVGQGAWNAVDSLQRGIYGDPAINQYNQSGGMSGAVSSALGPTGRKVVGEVGTTMGDATALMGLPKQLSAIGASAGQAGREVGQFGRAAGQEVRNAAGTMSDLAGPKPAYAMASAGQAARQAPAASAASVGQMAGRSATPVTPMAPMMASRLNAGISVEQEGRDKWNVIHQDKASPTPRKVGWIRTGNDNQVHGSAVDPAMAGTGAMTKAYAEVARRMPEGRLLSDGANSVGSFSLWRNLAQRTKDAGKDAANMFSVRPRAREYVNNGTFYHNTASAQNFIGEIPEKGRLSAKVPAYTSPSYNYPAAPSTPVPDLGPISRQYGVPPATRGMLGWQSELPAQQKEWLEARLGRKVTSAEAVVPQNESTSFRNWSEPHSRAEGAALQATRQRLGIRAPVEELNLKERAARTFREGTLEDSGAYKSYLAQKATRGQTPRVLTPSANRAFYTTTDPADIATPAMYPAREPRYAVSKPPQTSTSTAIDTIGPGSSPASAPMRTRAERDALVARMRAQSASGGKTMPGEALAPQQDVWDRAGAKVPPPRGAPAPASPVVTAPARAVPTAQPDARSMKEQFFGSAPPARQQDAWDRMGVKTPPPRGAPAPTPAPAARPTPDSVPFPDTSPQDRLVHNPLARANNWMTEHPRVLYPLAASPWVGMGASGYMASRGKKEGPVSQPLPPAAPAPVLQAPTLMRAGGRTSAR